METNQASAGTDSRHFTAEQYNYDHFKPGALMKDLELTHRPEGPRPGDVAPDFELQDLDGTTWRLGELRDRPVVLVLGSASCPMTQGGLPGLQGVYDDYQDRAQWLSVYVREAHPGEHLQPHRTKEQKREQASRLRTDEGVAWPILVDDLNGTTHVAYGLLPNPVFLIDADGRVAFRGDYSHGPTLRRALDHLVEQGGRGTVPEGEDKMMHMAGATAYGWEALRRSGDTAVRDVATGLPPLAANLWLGHQMKPVLDPLARRSRPLPLSLKAGLAFGAGLAAAGLWGAGRKA
jgi:hypothetical protein